MTHVIKAHGLTWHVDTLESGVGRNLRYRKGHQHEEVQALYNFLQDEGYFDRCDIPMIAIDIGANIGTFCIPFVLLDDRFSAIAIEPVSMAYNLLTRNVAENNLLSRIDRINKAVTDSPQQLSMTIPDCDSSKAEIRGQRQGFQGMSQILVEVKGMPLEDMVSLGAEDVCVVWSDTQGFETAVINTGVRFWKGGVPLYVELWPKGLDAHHGTAAFLEAASKHFRSFVERADLLKTPVQHPIDQLRATTQRLGFKYHTDVLLLP